MLSIIWAKLYLCALGNRMWGCGKHAIGLLWMTVGLWIGLPLLALPFIAGGVLYWRAREGTRPWLSMTHTPDWINGIKRGILVMPLAAVQTIATGQAWHLLVGAAAVVAVPAIYYFFGKIYSDGNTETVASELACGALIWRA